MEQSSRTSEAFSWVEDKSAKRAAEALGRDLLAMGYDLDNCQSFLTRGSSNQETEEERYVWSIMGRRRQEDISSSVGAVESNSSEGDDDEDSTESESTDDSSEDDSDTGEDDSTAENTNESNDKDGTQPKRSDANDAAATKEVAQNSARSIIQKLSWTSRESRNVPAKPRSEQSSQKNEKLVPQKQEPPIAPKASVSNEGGEGENLEEGKEREEEAPKHEQSLGDGSEEQQMLPTDSKSGGGGESGTKIDLDHEEMDDKQSIESGSAGAGSQHKAMEPSDEPSLSDTGSKDTGLKEEEESLGGKADSVELEQRQEEETGSAGEGSGSLVIFSPVEGQEQEEVGSVVGPVVGEFGTAEAGPKQNETVPVTTESLRPNSGTEIGIEEEEVEEAKQQLEGRHVVPKGEASDKGSRSSTAYDEKRSRRNKGSVQKRFFRRTPKRLSVRTVSSSVSETHRAQTHDKETENSVVLVREPKAIHEDAVDDGEQIHLEEEQDGSSASPADDQESEFTGPARRGKDLRQPKTKNDPAIFFAAHSTDRDQPTHLEMLGESTSLEVMERIIIDGMSVLDQPASPLHSTIDADQADVNNGIPKRHNTSEPKKELKQPESSKPKRGFWMRNKQNKAKTRSAKSKMSSTKREELEANNGERAGNNNNKDTQRSRIFSGRLQKRGENPGAKTEKEKQAATTAPLSPMHIVTTENEEGFDVELVSSKIPASSPRFSPMNWFKQQKQQETPPALETGAASLQTSEYDDRNVSNPKLSDVITLGDTTIALGDSLLATESHVPEELPTLKKPVVVPDNIEQDTTTSQKARTSLHKSKAVLSPLKRQGSTALATSFADLITVLIGDHAPEFPPATPSNSQTHGYQATSVLQSARTEDAQEMFPHCQSPLPCIPDTAATTLQTAENTKGPSGVNQIKERAPSTSSPINGGRGGSRKSPRKKRNTPKSSTATQRKAYTTPSIQAQGKVFEREHGSAETKKYDEDRLGDGKGESTVEKVEEVPPGSAERAIPTKMKTKNALTKKKSKAEKAQNDGSAENQAKDINRRNQSKTDHQPTKESASVEVEKSKREEAGNAQLLDTRKPRNRSPRRSTADLIADDPVVAFDRVKRTRSRSPARSRRPGQTNKDPIVTIDRNTPLQNERWKPNSPPKHNKSNKTKSKVKSFAEDWNELEDAAQVLENVMSTVGDQSNGTLDDAELLLSTGSSTLGDVEQALATLKKHAKKLGVKETDLLVAAAKTHDSVISARSDDAEGDFVEALSSYMSFRK